MLHGPYPVTAGLCNAQVSVGPQNSHMGHARARRSSPVLGMGLGAFYASQPSVSLCKSWRGALPSATGLSYCERESRTIFS